MLEVWLVLGKQEDSDAREWVRREGIRGRYR